MPPEMKWVESSNIDAIGYDDEAAELWVQFKSGSTYIYIDVPAAVAAELDFAPSKGSYFNRAIKPSYQFRQE
jgi:hypothetical protein